MKVWFFVSYNVKFTCLNGFGSLSNQCKQVRRFAMPPIAQVFVQGTTLLVTDSFKHSKYKLLKKVWKLKFDWPYLTYYHIFFIIICIIKKLVKLPFHWYHICNGYEIMGSTTAAGFKRESEMKSCKACVLTIIVKSRWRMNTMGYSLLGNASELQDFISDLHSYPVVMYDFINITIGVSF